MRPDEHKAKDARRYQARKKKQGDETASQVAEARRKAARDKGLGVNAIKRRNGENVETEEDKEERKKVQAKFAKRKIQSNVDRYSEETEQEAMQRDADMGIDRETTDLVAMLEEKDENTGASFFKFKEEQLFDDNSLKKQNELHKNIMQVDFNSFESILAAVDTKLVLNLSEEEDDLVQSAFNEHPVVLDKPMVPAFNKNAKGYVLFKSQQPTVIEKEVDGIYLRNDGSNHVKPIKKDKETDELDQLLSLETKPAEVKPSQPVPVKKVLPKPGSIKKLPVQNKMEQDDEAWLDDILG